MNKNVKVLNRQVKKTRKCKAIYFIKVTGSTKYLPSMLFNSSAFRIKLSKL